jgi:hypothetical protein
VASLTATIVLFKTASLTAELATKGLTIATLAQQVAQKALNLVMNANPYVLMATAVAGLATAVLALSLATEEAPDKVEALTEEERKLMEAADKAAESFREQQRATKEALGNINAEMGHVQDLAHELKLLAGASGEVQEKDRERAQFILNELNQALGTEYSMVDGVIQKYDTLKTSIDQVIQSKLANSLIEAANADYVQAVQNEAGALENLVLKEKDYQAQRDYTSKKYAEWLEAEARYTEVKEQYGERAAESLLYAANAAWKAYEDEKQILATKESDYEQAAATYGNYSTTIANYEEAQTAALEGNYQRAVDILSQKGKAFGQYSDKVDEETAKVLDALFKEAVDAGLEAERTKENFEKGVDGYTADMVTEAAQSYEDALNAYADARTDAEGVGEDLGGGLAAGMENKRSNLVSKARSLVSSVISAMRQEADSHSPARKTIDFGEDVGEGAEIGIENKTDDVAKAAQHQAAAMLEAYSSQEVAGQNALRNVAESRAAQQAASHMTAAAANNTMLGKILSALEQGQVLTIDSNILVGATAGKMDNTLGHRRELIARGAR